MSVGKIKVLRSSYFAIFSFSATSLFLLVRGEYGMNDDYVILGQIQQSSYGLLEIFYWFALSPYNTGRPVSALMQGMSLGVFNTVDSLISIRAISIFFWSISVTSLFYLLNRTFRPLYGICISLFIVFALPGGIFLLPTAVSLPYSIGFFLSIVSSYLLANSFRTNQYKRSVLGILIAIAVAFIYQPLLIILPLFSSINFVRSFKGVVPLLQSGIVAYLLLLVNYMISRNSPRLSGEIQLADKFSLILNEFLPRVMFPWFGLLGFSITKWWLVFGLILLTSLAFAHVVNPKNFIKRNWFKLAIFHVGVLMYGTLWLIGVSEGTVDYRRIFGASVLFWGGVLASIWPNSISRTRRSVDIFVSMCSFACIIITLFLMKTGIVEVQKAEWQAAKCASNRIALTNQDIYSNSILDVPYRFKELAKGDEFGKMSMNFAGPQTFLPYLSNNIVNGDAPMASAWGLSIGDSDATTKNGSLWSQYFEECWNDYFRKWNK